AEALWKRRHGPLLVESSTTSRCVFRTVNSGRNDRAGRGPSPMKWPASMVRTIAPPAGVHSHGWISSALTSRATLRILPQLGAGRLTPGSRNDNPAFFSRPRVGAKAHPGTLFIQDGAAATEQAVDGGFGHGTIGIAGDSAAESRGAAGSRHRSLSAARRTDAHDRGGARTLR